MRIFNVLVGHARTCPPHGIHAHLHVHLLMPMSMDVQVREKAKLTSYLPDATFDELKEFSATSATGAHLLVEVKGYSRVPAAQVLALARAPAIAHVHARASCTVT